MKPNAEIQKLMKSVNVESAEVIDTPRVWKEQPKTRIRISMSAPLEIAKEFVRNKCMDAHGVMNLHFWHGQFYQWSGASYGVTTLMIMEREVMFFLTECDVYERGKYVPCDPTPSRIRDVIYCLERCLALSDDCQPPAWLPDGEPATDVVVFRNKAVNMRTGVTAESGPDLWVHNVLEFDWDAEAKAPRWEQFLEEIFPNDKEAQDFIEEWMGYCMTDEVRHHKAAMFIGESRSGKGTITHIIRKLVGDKSYCALSFSNWMATENSSSVMIGRKVGVFPDVRLKDGRGFGFKSTSGYDAGGLNHNSQGQLLQITGGDPITLGRKNISLWEGQLRVKIMILSNAILNLGDPTLTKRFIKVPFSVSFYGREDISLLGKLEAELPGIAARCVKAYQRLCRNGEFVQPKSGLALERALQSAVDPFAAFLLEGYRWNSDHIGAMKPTVRFALNEWCSANSRMDLFNSLPENKMGEAIRKVPGFERVRDHRPNDPATGKQGPRRWLGLEPLKRE